MTRFFTGCLLSILGLALAGSSLATQNTARPHKTQYRRSMVEVHHEWPLRRAQRMVVVHPARVRYGVTPAAFLPVVMWSGAVSTRKPVREDLLWEDGETFIADVNWTQFTLNCSAPGTKLWLQVAKGSIQFDWAEVTFDNGATCVVDMRTWIRGPGLYTLLEFPERRRVDHLRMVARARTEQARVVARLELRPAAAASATAPPNAPGAAAAR